MGDIFSAVDGVEIDSTAVVVEITADDTVTATVGENADIWADTTVSFTGTGTVTFTITDGDLCNTAEATVTVTEPESKEKFNKKFDKDFLYRIGNQNEVTLSYLFSAKDDLAVPVDSTKVDVTCEVIEGTPSEFTYTANTADWTQGKIKFAETFTGVVKVTITDNNFCIPTELYLEVVDATNTTSAPSTTTGGNFVLVADVSTNTYKNLWNCTVYGNGFTYSLAGAPTTYNSKQGHGILITQNAVLDNLVIIGDVYNAYGAYSDQDYYNAVIDVQGETTIQNCYIAIVLLLL